MKRICLLLFLPAYLFAQTSGITTTKEYYPNNKIRRIIKTDNDFNVISEIYYRNSNSLPIAEIDYRSKNEIKSVVFFKNDGINKKYLIDFNRGLYIDYLNNISLSFKDNFVFDGKQTGNKIISYYKNGKRSGPVLQFDSTSTGRVLSNKAFVDYNYTTINGQVFITGKTLVPLYEDSFSIYKGIYCNFRNDELDGSNNVFYFNGRKKIQSNFTQGKCNTYSSFDNKGILTTKIKCKDGILTGKAIINGSVNNFDDNNLVWFHSLSGAGRIYATLIPRDIGEGEASLYFTDVEESFPGTVANQIVFNLPNRNISADKWNTGQYLKYKNDFDKKLSSVDSPFALRFLLGIPYFFITRFDFDVYDKEEFTVIKINKNSYLDSAGLHPVQYLINPKDSLLYSRNLFFKDDNYHTWSNFFENTIWTNIENLSKIAGIYKHYFTTWLKNAFNYTYTGDEDVFLNSADSLNKNEKVTSFLQSYSKSVILNCIALHKNENITKNNFINPLYHFQGQIRDLPSIDKDKVFQIFSKDGNMLFYIDEKDSDNNQTINFNLLEKENGIKYAITFDLYELSHFSDIIRENSWKFTISDENEKEFYRNSNGNVEVNVLNDKIKKSLEKIDSAFKE